MEQKYLKDIGRSQLPDQAYSNNPWYISHASAVRSRLSVLHVSKASMGVR